MKIAVLAALMCSLGSCSIGYTVDVLLQGNQLVFRFEESGWLSGSEAVPVESIFVRELSANNPLVWEIKSNDYNGRNLRELRYGTSPSGMTQKVPPAPLRVGQVYLVEMLASGGGGSRQFAILPGPGPSQPITVLSK